MCLKLTRPHIYGRLQLKCGGTRRRKGEQVKWKLANGVDSQYPSHYFGTWCIQHYYSWCTHLGCQSSSVGATARGGPWPPLQHASRSLSPLLCLSIRLYPSFSGPWTRHPAISFLVFLFALLHTAFRTASFLGLMCLAFFLYAQAILFFGI